MPDLPSQPRKPTGLRKWLYRLGAMTLVPALLFGVIELSLRMGGFGDATDFFLDGARLELADVWIDNRDFGRWVFPRSLEQMPQPVPFVLPRHKASDTYRIFVLGESAAQGFPDPSISFARVLEVMLRERYPDRRFEIINTAMVAINSHVALPIARQCASRQPDLFIVHLGNNEVVGPFGAAGVLGPFSPNLSLIRANLAAKSTRTGQLVHRLIDSLGRGRQQPQEWGGMSMFIESRVGADDERLSRIRAHFRANLRDVCQAGADQHVPVILCTIPVNLQDSAPFASRHASGLGDEQTKAWDALFKTGTALEADGKTAAAMRAYDDAQKLDAEYAELAYRQGRCSIALGKHAEARAHFQRACDLDALRFRSDTHVNAVVREVAADLSGTGVHLADAERVFGEASATGSPGEDFFLEHVHMTFKGNVLLARTLLDTIRKLPLPGAPAEGKLTPLTEQECARRLGHTPWSEWKFASQMHDQLMQSPPFTSQYDHAERDQRWQAKLTALRKRLRDGGMAEAIARTQLAAEAADSDWMVRITLGDMLGETGDFAGANEQYLEALARCRHHVAAHTKAGGMMLKLEQPRDAERQYRDALQIAPDDAEARIGLAESLEGQGQSTAALAIYQEELRQAPNRAYAPAAYGRFLFRAGKLDEARAQFTEALRREPKKAAIHVDLATTALKQSNIDEAIEHYETALRIQPDWPELREHLADVRKQHPAGKSPDRR